MGKRINAFSDDALGTMDATALAEAIKLKKVSVKEVTEAAIARAEKVNPELNAIVLKTYDSALNESKLNSNGAFFGVPTFVKDNDFIQGLPTQKGADAYNSKIAKKNSKFVNQFFSSGVNCLGKSTLPEFAFICSTENDKLYTTRNPWDTDYTTGGSSSGSSALVASGVVPIATANDGAGSTRIPASCCGLVGLKPTRDRVYYMQGTETLPVNIAYQGVLTRSVRDTITFYTEAEKYHYNKKLPQIGAVNAPLKRRLKIAMFENIADGQQGYMDEDTWRVQLETARLLETLGHTVEMIKVPVDIEEMTLNYVTYYGFLAYMSINFGRISQGVRVDKSKVQDPFTHSLANTFSKRKLKLISSVRALVNASKVTERDMYQKYDVLMTAVTAKRKPKIGYFSPDLPGDELVYRGSDFATYLPLFNISGAPAISLPLGVASNDMPVGVQFVAPHGQDKLLLELSLELEAASPWRFIYE